MARVTVEDCVLRLPNRFELVMLAAQRARGISSGAPLTVDRDKDKNPVVALREIAEDRIDLRFLEDELIRSQQKYVARDDTEEDVPEFDALEGELEASARMAADSLQTGAAGEAGAEAVPEDGDQGESLEELAEREAMADEETDAGSEDEERE